MSNVNRHCFQVLHSSFCDLYIRVLHWTACYTDQRFTRMISSMTWQQLFCVVLTLAICMVLCVPLQNKVGEEIPFFNCNNIVKPFKAFLWRFTSCSIYLWNEISVQDLQYSDLTFFLSLFHEPNDMLSRKGILLNLEYHERESLVHSLKLKSFIQSCTHFYQK